MTTEMNHDLDAPRTHVFIQVAQADWFVAYDELTDILVSDSRGFDTLEEILSWAAWTGYTYYRVSTAMDLGFVAIPR